jgi:DNA replication ATP-dependent helicase Dna2
MSNPTVLPQPLNVHVDMIDLAEETETDAGSAVKYSSDYGDDEFDDDTLLELDANLCTIQEDDSTLVASEFAVQRAAAVVHIKENDENKDETSTMDDDFGDLDDDLLEAAEDILTKVASQGYSQPATTNINKGQDTLPRQVPGVLDGEEDDPYGDDFGDFDFDAAELAATQSASASRNTGTDAYSQHVRIIHR